MTYSSFAIVIGSGIAGVSIASMLAKQGWKVAILDRCDRIAARASGNIAGILSPYILSQHDRSGEYLGAAFAFSRDWLSQWTGADSAFHASGIVQLPATRRLIRMVKEAHAGDLVHPELDYLDAAQVRELSGVSVNSEALYYRRGGWVEPRKLCERFVLEASPHVRFHFGFEVTELLPLQSGWEAVSAGGERIGADIAIIANAYECNRFTVSQSLPLEAVRGITACGAPPPETMKLKTVLCHNGYVIPLASDQQLFGTTYRHGVFHTERDPAEEHELAAQLAKWIPGAQPEFSAVRICFRTSTSDRLPYVGELAPALYVSVGHGSRGLVSAPYAAQIVADSVAGRVLPPAAEIVSPHRPRRGKLVESTPNGQEI